MDELEPAAIAAVRTVAMEYLAALSAEDGNRVCAVLTPEGRRVLVGLAQAVAPEITDCPAAGDLLYQGFGRTFGQAELGQVVIDGGRARVTASHPELEDLDAIILLRMGDEWRVDHTDGRPASRTLVGWWRRRRKA